MVDKLKDSNLSDLLLWLLRRRLRFRIAGNSMTPLLKSGDEVLVNPRAYQQMTPQSGDIVVARHPYRKDLRLVKRVAAVLDDGSCIIEGDNSSESTDSRSFGAIFPKHIFGQVTSRFL
ncbi:nickel-type superoxide dismutase maturation protease [bacterium]|nr:nickel-type superoxide dismutase maturation protease [bacterium]